MNALKPAASIQVRLVPLTKATPSKPWFQNIMPLGRSAGASAPHAAATASGAATAAAAHAAAAGALRTAAAVRATAATAAAGGATGRVPRHLCACERLALR